MLGRIEWGSSLRTGGHALVTPGIEGTDRLGRSKLYA